MELYLGRPLDLLLKNMLEGQKGAFKINQSKVI